MGQYVYVKVPKPILPRDRLTSKPLCVDENERFVREDATGARPWFVSMSRFLSQAIFSEDPRWTRNAKAIKAAVAIQMAFDAMELEPQGTDYEGTVRLLDDDWKELKKAIEEPKHTKYNAFGQPEEVPGFGGFTGSVLQQLLPFITAIEEAKDRPPEETKT